MNSKEGSFVPCLKGSERPDNICWDGRVKNKEELYGTKVAMNIQHTVK
jgi:hypothetical protein